MDSRVYEAVLYSEYRSQRYKERRVKQLRRRFALFAVTVIMAALLALSYSTIFAHATSEDDIRYKYFTSIQVEYGDTLSSIAETYLSDRDDYASVSEYIEEVVSINHLKDETILAGQYLIVPYYSAELH